MKQLKWEIIGHIIFWGLAYWLLLQSFSSVRIEKIIINGRLETNAETIFAYFPVLYFIVAKLVLAYVNAFIVLPAYLKSKNTSVFLVNTIVIFTFTFGLEVVLNYLHFLLGAYDNPEHYFGSVFLNIILSIFFWFISAVYVFGKRHAQHEQMNQQLKQEKLSTELKYLKSQINPHFLFNTLNNLFALSERSNNIELSEGIAELSNLIRYLLHDTESDRVSLKKEIAQLESIIKLEKLRISEQDDVQVSLNTRGNISNQKIAPMILVPFVENAFKHGINPQKSSVIKIELNVNGHILECKVLNSNYKRIANKKITREDNGIGLKNVKRRLKLLYPGNHELLISDKHDVFEVLLYLNL